MGSRYVIIVAGGVGARMGGNVPKQFSKLSGKEIIVHAIQKFLDYDPAIRMIVAVHPSYRALLDQTLNAFRIKGIQIAQGGETRYHSVKNALALINDPNAIVGIHDAARPLVSLGTIRKCFDTAEEKGNAVPAISLPETLREKKDGGSRAVNRKDFVTIQTPQCFLVSKIKKAFELPYSENFTDDASVLEAGGEKINLVEGNKENIKITHPQDLLIAKVLLEHEQR
jgi:2-C-methyl-D-erythritol 4-phosphate cytidylyltransferase